VRAQNARKVNRGSLGPMFLEYCIFILDTGKTHDIISFARRGH